MQLSDIACCKYIVFHICNKDTCTVQFCSDLMKFNIWSLSVGFSHVSCQSTAWILEINFAMFRGQMYLLKHTFSLLDDLFRLLKVKWDMDNDPTWMLTIYPLCVEKVLQNCCWFRIPFMVRYRRQVFTTKSLRLLFCWFNDSLTRWFLPSEFRQRVILIDIFYSSVYSNIMAWP